MLSKLEGQGHGRNTDSDGAGRVYIWPNGHCLVAAILKGGILQKGSKSPNLYPFEIKALTPLVGRLSLSGKMVQKNCFI